MTRQRLDVQEWHLCNGRDCRGREMLFAHADRQAVLRWLTAARLRPLALSRLRQALMASSLTDLLGQPSDEELLERISWLVATRRLHICRERQQRVHYAIGRSGAEPVKAPAFPDSLKHAKAVYEPPRMQRVEEPAPPTFLPDASPAAIAAVMKSAAQSGVPFCEECMKAKLRQDAGKLLAGTQ